MWRCGSRQHGSDCDAECRYIILNTVEPFFVLLRLGASIITVVPLFPLELSFLSFVITLHCIYLAEAFIKRTIHQIDKVLQVLHLRNDRYKVFFSFSKGK